MKQLIGGLALGAALGAGGYFLVENYVHVVEPDCEGLCGAGTICSEGRCVVAPAEVEAAPEPEPEDGKTKRKGKRGRKAKAGDDGAEGAEPGEGPPIDDDSSVPRFDPNADQTIGMSDGTGRLSDADIDRELGKLDKQLEACVRSANERVDELGTGTVKYSFGIAGTGKVTGVNASAPDNLKQAGIIPCVRKVVYAHRFPAFDGPTMKASSSFTVR